jgi:hypothetical protein
MVVLVCLAPAAAHGKGQRAAELDLEPSLQLAALVMAARVDDVGEVRVVYGGKGSDTLYQYTFEPIRVLKGVYSRPQLLMTSVDLRGYAGSFDPQDIRRGDQRLLVLGRSTVGYLGIHPGSTADQAFPRIDGSRDPLLSAVEVLLGQEAMHDRLEMVTGLSRRLGESHGRGAVALLAALDRRPYVAAQHVPAFQAIGHQLGSDSALVREAAAQVMASLLDADYLGNQSAHRDAVAGLVTALRDHSTPLASRVAALAALAAAPDAMRANPDAVALVAPDGAYDTFAELSGRLDVLGRLYEGENDGRGGAVSSMLAGVPLDAGDGLQQSASRAWALIAESDGADDLLDRLRRKKALGLDATAEVAAFGFIFPKLSNPWPLQRALLETELTVLEQQQFVQACERAPSARLVAALADMLDPRHSRLHRLAADLLVKIDTKAAAEAIRPHLAGETDLAYKLLLAAFLGRHGLDDGYTYALEHMSDLHYLEASIEALGAIRKPGSAEQLLDIYRNSNDLRWKRAAVRGLGAVGYEPFRDELMELTQDLAHPLAASALLARADLGDQDLIEDLPAVLSSRSESVAIGGARAAGKLLPQDGRGGRAASVVRADLATVAKDPEATLELRRQALEALVVSEDPRLDEVLVALIRDRRIEQSNLLPRTRELMRERRVRI